MEDLSKTAAGRVNAETAQWPGQDRARLSAEVARIIQAEGLETVRLVFADQHGVMRGKTLVAAEAISLLDKGCSVTTTLLLKDTSHRTVFPIWSEGGGFNMPELQGAADLMMMPDPSTFRILPWSPRSGWLQCDLLFQDGRSVPFSTRQVMRDALAGLDARGMDFVAGLEVEFHLFRQEDARMALQDAGQPGTPPDVSLTSRGYQYLTEQRYDAVEPILDILRRNIQALGLPLVSVEVEYGPSQFEFTFAPTENLVPADLMVLFRAAIKQIAARHGYHATFMCRPQMTNGMASGWHLHQSLRQRSDGANLFIADAGAKDPLSPLGMGYLAGLLKHARAGALFTTPTLNGYKRYRSFSLAPDRAIWGRDNRGVMARVLGGPGDKASRIENRVGEPLANPYLYMASQIHAGLDGIDTSADPGPSADSPYDTDAPFLPKSLDVALDALRSDRFFADKIGAGFIEYYCQIKQAELDRFHSEVSNWEQREYFDIF